MISHCAVFLDRDDVSCYNLTEMEILPGVAEAINRFKDPGLLRIVVTKQPNVARGTETREAIGAMNLALVERLPLDDVFTCDHDTPDRCSCRKPLPGASPPQTAERHGIDLAGSFMVGDRWSDAVAGLTAGCRTFLIAES